VIIVNQTSQSYARVSFWVRRTGACSLTRKFLTTTARIGRNGTVAGTERKQGSGTTPRGTYTITETFGNGPAPYTSMPYHEVRNGDYWVGDNQSRYYNNLRNSADGGFRWWLRSGRNESENLRAFGAQYRYVAVINFNRAPDARVAYRGFGIFLHVKNGRGTAGCIGISATQMRQVLRYLRPGDKITIRR
jgi:L,D-peptidoglycan transpeptidase YkuD (ErfK/YbiS/YcfS/YnhG family)